VNWTLFAYDNLYQDFDAYMLPRFWDIKSVVVGNLRDLLDSARTSRRNAGNGGLVATPTDLVLVERRTSSSRAGDHVPTNPIYQCMVVSTRVCRTLSATWAVPIEHPPVIDALICLHSALDSSAKGSPRN
jgi:hypothetical protein